MFQIPKYLKGAWNKQSIKARLSVYGRPVTASKNSSQVILGHAFQKSVVITIEIPEKSIFIQTDKPIYKPGQTGNANDKLTSWVNISSSPVKPKFLKFQLTSDFAVNTVYNGLLSAHS